MNKKSKEQEIKQGNMLQGHQGLNEKHSFESDIKDKLRALDDYGPTLVRCNGGRIIVQGYVCPHCHSVDPSKECDLPKEPDITVNVHTGKFHVRSQPQVKNPQFIADRKTDLGD